eukprot:6019508-Prymnesium_polylepis.1
MPRCTDLETGGQAKIGCDIYQNSVWYLRPDQNGMISSTNDGRTTNSKNETRRFGRDQKTKLPIDEN